MVPGAQIPAAVRSWTQTWPPAGPSSECVKTLATGGRVVHSDTVARAAALPSATNMATGGGPERDIRVTLLVTQAMNINTNPSFGRTDPDMVLDNSLCSDAVMATQISITSATGQSSGTSKAKCGRTNPEHPHSLRR